MDARRKGALVGGIAVGVLGLFSLVRHLGHPGGAAGGLDASGGQPVSRARFLPWLFGAQPTPTAEPLPDLYTGEKVPITVKVVDLQSAPVPGAEVTMLSDPGYVLLGLSEEQTEQFKAMLEKRHQPLPASLDLSTAETPDSADSSDKEQDDSGQEDEERVVVDGGRTDRDGIWVAQVKPDAEVLFLAREGAREGVSASVYAMSGSAPEGGTTLAVHGASPDSNAVVIEIGELGVVKGLVTDARGQPVGGASLHLTAWSGSEIEPSQLVAEGNGSGDARQTGPDGRFRIPLRSSGAFDLEVHAQGFQPALKQAVQVLPGKETDLTISLEPSAVLAGQVLGPDGRPLSGATVTVQSARPLPSEEPPGEERIYAPNRTITGSHETTTDEEGRFTAEELAPGTYVVAAAADGLRPAELWGVATGGAPVTLQLTRGGTLHGEISADPSFLATLPSSEMVAQNDDWGDSPRAPEESPDAPAGGKPGMVWSGDVFLGLAGEEADPVPLASGVAPDRVLESPSGLVDGHGRFFSQARLDAQGRGSFDVAGLPPGTYAGHVMLGTAIVRVPPTRVWDGGTATVRLSLPEGGSASIRGRIHPADGGAITEGNAFLYGPALPTGMSAATGPDGRFSFASLPPGEYTIHAVAAPAESKDPSAGGAMPLQEGRPATMNYAPPRQVTLGPGDTLELDLEAGQSSPNTWVGDAELLDSAGNPVASQGDFRMGQPDDGSHGPEPLYTPEVNVQLFDDEELVVTNAPPGPPGERLFGGDRVVSIDGASADDSSAALGQLYGAKDSLCTIVARRPLTGETVTVALPRTRATGADTWE